MQNRDIPRNCEPEIKLIEVLRSGDPVAAAAAAELRVNGSVSGSVTMQHPVSITRASSFIGHALYDSCTSSFSGAIAEVIMYSRKLSADERVAVESYLMNKWQCCR